MQQLGAGWDGALSALGSTQPDPPTWVLYGTALVALIMISGATSWRHARHLVTLAHEGGHAAVALLSGRRLHGVRLHSDTSGLTLSAGRPSGPGMIATAAAGYPAPTVLGLIAALGLASGHVTATLWGWLVLLAALLVAIRNAFGVLSVLGTGAILAAVAIWADPAVQGAFAHLLTWFLLLAGPRPVLELQHKRRRGRVPISDADQLARLTGLPSLVWVLLFLLITVGGVAAGALLLLPLPSPA